MNIRTAMLAACASMLLLAANLAHAGEPIPGVDVKLGKNPPDPVKKPTIRVDTGNMGNGGRGQKISENDSPRPVDRKSQRKKTGPGTGNSEIFDRWGNSKK